MEKFQEYLADSKKSIQIADHMIFVTYKLVQDPKLLLSAIKRIYRALECATNSLLHYERLFKRIPPFPENFPSKFIILKDRCMNRLGLTQSYLYLIQDIHSLLLDHQKSPMEFVRRNRLIICSNNYRTKRISIEEMKEYLSKGKSFINDVEKIVMKNARIFS